MGLIVSVLKFGWWSTSDWQKPDVDAIPDESTKRGRDVWLTMACMAAFPVALDIRTYKKVEGGDIKLKGKGEVEGSSENGRET